jgi:uncharacterized protein with GYD domain
MHYLALGRYTPQGAAGVLKDGLTSRKDVVRGLMEATGGRLIGLWGVDSGDVDFVILMEGEQSPAEGTAVSLGQKSMGHLAEIRTYRLVETEDVDATLQRMNTVTRAPGEG